jgi:hypothetical protein
MTEAKPSLARLATATRHCNATTRYTTIAAITKLLVAKTANL